MTTKVFVGAILAIGTASVVWLGMQSTSGGCGERTDHLQLIMSVQRLADQNLNAAGLRPQVVAGLSSDTEDLVEREALNDTNHGYCAAALRDIRIDGPVEANANLRVIETVWSYGDRTRAEESLNGQDPFGERQSQGEELGFESWRPLENIVAVPGNEVARMACLDGTASSCVEWLYLSLGPDAEVVELTIRGAERAHAVPLAVALDLSTRWA